MTELNEIMEKHECLEQYTQLSEKINENIGQIMLIAITQEAPDPTKLDINSMAMSKNRILLPASIPRDKLAINKQLALGKLEDTMLTYDSTQKPKLILPLEEYAFMQYWTKETYNTWTRCKGGLALDIGILRGFGNHITTTKANKQKRPVQNNQCAADNLRKGLIIYFGEEAEFYLKVPHYPEMEIAIDLTKKKEYQKIREIADKSTDTRYERAMNALFE